MAQCPQLAEAGKSYCAGHGRALANHYKRSNPFTSHYGRQWRKKQAEYLEKNPHCVVCGSLASNVDHIIPVRFGGTDDDENLRSMCHSCHSRHTSKRGGGFGNKITL